MATYNQNLENLTIDEILHFSNLFLRGWQDFSQYGFRLKGLNRKRIEHGLEPLTKEDSLQYRINYVKQNYSQDDIEQTLREYVASHLMDKVRWEGIELFDCRFGREYISAFRQILGSATWRKISEQSRVDKLCQTQAEKYGGIGLASASIMQAATDTMIEKYGVTNAMYDASIKAKHEQTNLLKYGGASPMCDKVIQKRSRDRKMEVIVANMEHFKKNGIIDESVFKQSPAELIVFEALINKFGKQDVYYQYGIHPKDDRYPYACDFYIKSLDLFIEINAHYSHYTHWFDPNCHDDVLRKKHLEQSDSHRSKKSLVTWCEKDLEKRDKARQSGINYLVFWDGTTHQENKNRNVPNLQDFFSWYYDYDCDFKTFLLDNPNNGY